MSNQRKNILLLGSGLMSETVVAYLNKRKENHIVIGSNLLEEALKISKKYQNCEAKQVDVSKKEELDPVVKDSDIVISYVPWIFHHHVAESCLQFKKHMVTASYISPALRKVDKQAAEKGLTFLNEVGVDPGIDHIATMKVVDEVREKGEKIISYESWCGGLPAPEFVDNPLGYKFSWSPLGAFLALKNDAKYIEGGKEKDILGEELLYHSKAIDIKVEGAPPLEGYPNRNSVLYKDLYDMQDVQDLKRGTLRFTGFSLFINCFKALGLMDNDNKVGLFFKKTPLNWPTFLKIILEKDNVDHNLYTEAFAQLNTPKAEQHFIGAILKRTLSHPFYQRKSQQEKVVMSVRLIKGLKELKFFDTDQAVNTELTYIANLVKLLEITLNLKSGEADLLVMQHRFVVQRKDNTKYNIKSTLVQIGEKNGKSAMSVLVGTPTAIATQLILDGIIKDKGVLMPNKKSIYLPIFKELEKEGIKCVEEIEDSNHPKPKL